MKKYCLLFVFTLAALGVLAKPEGPVQDRDYKEGTPHMIKSLELVSMRPLDEKGMEKIFIKQQQDKR